MTSGDIAGLMLVGTVCVAFLMFLFFFWRSDD